MSKRQSGWRVIKLNAGNQCPWMISPAILQSYYTLDKNCIHTRSNYTTQHQITVLLGIKIQFHTKQHISNSLTTTIMWPTWHRLFSCQKINQWGMRKYPQCSGRMSRGWHKVSDWRSPYYSLWTTCLGMYLWTHQTCIDTPIKNNRLHSQVPTNQL